MIDSLLDIFGAEASGLNSSLIYISTHISRVLTANRLAILIISLHLLIATLFITLWERVGNFRVPSLNGTCQDLCRPILFDQNCVTDGNNWPGLFLVHLLKSESDMKNHARLNNIFVSLIDQQLVLFDSISNLKSWLKICWNLLQTQSEWIFLRLSRHLWLLCSHAQLYKRFWWARQGLKPW